MDKEEDQVAERQTTKRLKRQREVLVGRQKPCAQAGQDHLEPDEGRMAMAEHEGHDGVSLVSATVQEDEGEERIKHRANDDEEYEPGHTSGKAVYVCIAPLSDSPKALAAAVQPQGAP